VSFTDKAVMNRRYDEARDFYLTRGVDTDRAMAILSRIPISIHCWQGDDIRGFTDPDIALSGGIQVTGSCKGRARNAVELRADLDAVFSFIPGPKRLNLHAIYAETGPDAVPRDELRPEHFAAWVEWAKSQNIGLDFNPTLFSHPLAEDGLTLSHPDAVVREFWIRHCIACRRIGEYFGRELGSPCVTNLWIPDGYKDIPANRLLPRTRLLESLDRIFAEKIDEKYNIDAVESKVFGLGSEAYVTGSHEFYYGYAVTRRKMLCLDLGHFHPTESVADKISPILLFTGRVLLHLSRPMRWDSDHVVILDSALEETAREIVRAPQLDHVHLALDFFDASINRLAAWTIGARNARKAMLFALLEPAEQLLAAEENLDFTRRLTLLEESKTWPRSDVWNRFCAEAGVPIGDGWYDCIMEIEKETLGKRI